MANFLQEMIKDAIRDVVKEQMSADAQTLSKPQEDASNSVNDKNTTENADTAKQGLQSVTEAPKPEAQTFSTADLQKLVKSEVTAMLTKELNEAPATDASAVDVDAVYCELLGFPTTKKGD